MHREEQQENIKESIMAEKIEYPKQTDEATISRLQSEIIRLKSQIEDLYARVTQLETTEEGG